MQIVEQIRKFIPFNEQEEHDRAELLYLLETGEGRDLFTRENKTAHMTASAWVVNRHRSKVLMVYHNIYHSWSWLGGHADGEQDLLNVAIREVQEESGIQNVTPVSDDIFSLEILTVDGHEKRGEYVSSHLHLNVTYLLQADDTENLHMKPDENSGVSWFTPQGAVEASTEDWFKQRIYPKLNEKLAVMEQKTNKK